MHNQKLFVKQRKKLDKLQNKRMGNTLLSFIDEHLEVDYGYLSKSNMDDNNDTCADEYIQEIKDDFKKMREKACIKKGSLQKSIDLLKRLDEI